MDKPVHMLELVVEIATTGEPPPSEIVTFPFAVQPSDPVAVNVYVSVAFTVATGLEIDVELSELVVFVNDHE